MEKILTEVTFLPGAGGYIYLSAHDKIMIGHTTIATYNKFTDLNNKTIPCVATYKKHVHAPDTIELLSHYFYIRAQVTRDADGGYCWVIKDAHRRNIGDSK